MPDKLKVTVFSAKKYDKKYLEEANSIKNEFEFIWYDAILGEHISKVIEPTDAVCVFVNDTLDRPVLTDLKDKGVKYIALRCAGYNKVDTDAAKELGLRVVRVPAYSPEAVAEHAWALLMTLNRKVHKAHLRVRDYNFNLEGLVGMNIHGKTIGVVGTGNIGKAFCNIANGFGAKVIAYDLYPDKELKCEYVEYDKLLAESDIISLHCPLNKDSHHMINKESIAKMKDGVFLVNTSRGALIDTNAISHALESGKIGQLAIDVYEQEDKLFFRDWSDVLIHDRSFQILQSYQNVLVTSHQAFFTDEALSQIARFTIGNLAGLRDDTEIPDKRGYVV